MSSKLTGLLGTALLTSAREANTFPERECHRWNPWVRLVEFLKPLSCPLHEQSKTPTKPGSSAELKKRTRQEQPISSNSDFKTDFISCAKLPRKTHVQLQLSYSHEHERN